MHPQVPFCTLCSLCAFLYTMVYNMCNDFHLWESLNSKSGFIFSRRCWVQKHWIGKIWKVGKRFGVVQRARVYHSGTFFSWCYLFTDPAGIVREGSSSIYLSLLQYIFCSLCWWSNDWEEGKQILLTWKCAKNIFHATWYAFTWMELYL